MPGVIELPECRRIGGVALALEYNVLVPVQAVVLQAVENATGSARFFPRRVEIFHSHQPATLMLARVQKARQGGYQ